MASVVGFPRDDEQHFTSWLGMMIFLCSWGMVFGGLFFAFGVYRVRAASWPPPGTPAIPLGLPAAATLVLLFSSGALHRGIRAMRRGRPARLKHWLGLAMLLGVLFLGLQWRLWAILWARGLHASSSLYGSLFFALTLFHALHVVAGLCILGWHLPGALVHRYTVHGDTGLRLGAMFWYFVDLVWILTFTLLFVV